MARTPVPPIAEIAQAEIDLPDLDPDLLAEAAAYDRQDTPPWAPPDPGAVARQFVQVHPDAQLELVFPTVFEEDRSAKLADLITAESAGTISHHRMAQQAAQELGFSQYDYAAEQEQIARARQALTPTPSEDAALEALSAEFHEQMMRLTEVVRSMPPPVRVTVPDAPLPTVEVRIPPVPDPPRIVKTVERDARGLITRIVEGEA
jgi:hypothetical protein